MRRKKLLITGGVGFVGSHLTRYLIQKEGYEIVVLDKLDPDISENLVEGVTYIKGDITSIQDIKRAFEKGPFLAVYHLASAMPNKAVSNDVLWETNVSGTSNLISESVNNRVNSFIFTSSNVTYGNPFTLPVTEEMPLKPLEIYGKSKQQAEKELEKFKKNINIQIFRCPVITGTGRLGLQAILFEFISENRNVYLLGDGSNKYQFIDVMDIAIALEKASHIRGFDIYTVGADEVMSLRNIYKHVIDFAGSRSKIVPLPITPALFILSILDKMNLSPLGVYQYTMLGRSLYADTKKVKKKLNWKPKKTNLDTFIENYKWYIDNKEKFTKVESGIFSSNRSLPKMGVFKLLKILS